MKQGKTISLLAIGAASALVLAGCAAAETETEAETKTDEENGKRIQELQEFEQNIREFQAQAQQEMQKKQQELTSPVFEKAKNAILTVGKAKGFDYVLDSSEGQGVLFAGGTDLMQDVKVELGF